MLTLFQQNITTWQAQRWLLNLGRYTHKICISNHRIIHISDTHVTIRYTDRKIKKSKTKTIKGAEFIKLFAEHILPKGMVKIRHIGILSSRTKQQDLAIIRKHLNAPTPPPKVKMTTRELIKLTTGKDPNLCPCCQKGEMVIVSVMPAIRGSPIKTPIRFAPKGRKIKLSHN